MPLREWSTEFNAWIKKCSNEACYTGIYIGTSDIKESNDYFLKIFGRHDRASDGFRIRCLECEATITYNRDYCDRQLLLDKQNGHCAICEEIISWGDKTARVDHERKSGRIRGILCNRCNVMLGILDNKRLLGRANEYLSKFEFEEEFECE
jgi:hypothetical protein